MLTQKDVPLEQGQQTFYMIKIPGQPSLIRYTSRNQAEDALNFLPESVRHLAEIIPTDSQGRQLLFEDV